MPRPTWEERVIEHFNRSALTYGDSYIGDTPVSHFFRTRQAIVLSALEALPNGRLLDVGCGPGLMVQPCIERGFVYSGIDISERMIAECRRRFGDAHAASFLVAKVQSLPFPDCFFDALLCMGTLEYVPDYEQILARAEMIRIVKPGGLLLISHLNKFSPYWLWERFVYRKLRAFLKSIRGLIRGADGELEEPRVPVLKFGEGPSRRLLEAQGLAVGEALYYGFNLFLPPFDTRFPRLTTRAIRRWERLAQGRLRRLAMAFILVARKRRPDSAQSLGRVE